MTTAEPICCTPKFLPGHLLVPAAQTACAINPVNHPPVRGLVMLTKGKPKKQDAVMMVTKYWGAAGVHLTVSFLDNTPADVQARILTYANLWSKTANIKFTLTPGNPHAQVRISTGPGGYWSYLGTDILTVREKNQTMNLEGIDMQTPHEECLRVIPHEFGHTLGMPHEHQRKEEVARINPKKAIPFYMRTQGWNRREVIAQVLTPLNAADFLLATKPDDTSIMAYQISGQLTFDGKPILGGLDINANDYAFVSLLYPIPKVAALSYTQGGVTCS